MDLDTLVNLSVSDFFAARDSVSSELYREARKIRKAAREAQVAKIDCCCHICNRIRRNNIWTEEFMTEKTLSSCGSCPVCVESGVADNFVG